MGFKLGKARQPEITYGVLKSKLKFGGEAGGSIQNVLQYVAIQTTGNSTDFGDLLSSKEAPSSLSGDAA